MENVLLYVAVLACPVGMGVCMWLMGKGMRHGHDKPSAAEARDGQPTVEELRREHERISGEIAKIEEREGAASRR